MLVGVGTCKALPKYVPGVASVSNLASKLNLLTVITVKPVAEVCITFQVQQDQA